MARVKAPTAVTAKPAPLSEESVRLINEYWDTIELIRKHRPSWDEIQQELTVASPTKADPAARTIMSEYQLRQLCLKIRNTWQHKDVKPPAEYKDPDPGLHS